MSARIYYSRSVYIKYIKNVLACQLILTSNAAASRMQKNSGNLLTTLSVSAIIDSAFKQRGVAQFGSVHGSGP